jgi:hypothetical protein
MSGNRLISGMNSNKKRLAFADPLDMVTCLTTERVHLTSDRAPEAADHFVAGRELGRNRGAGTRDVKKLAEFGLVCVRR